VEKDDFLGKVGAIEDAIAGQNIGVAESGYELLNSPSA
jgi:hypothetical protein